MALAKRAAEARQRRIRTILLTVILITIPFYCVGFVLWASAPQQNRPPTATPPPSNTPRDDDEDPTATNVPGQPSVTPIGGGGSTVIPITLNPPTSSFPSPTRFITATATRLMTFTPLPPTATTVPPTNAPPPTNTELPLPFDTPLPFDELP